ncbi:MAG: pseudouridine synthase [Candidatus Woesearchaeota archaeon]
MADKIRVQKIISTNTNYSRRAAEKLIEEGRIRVNNKIIKIGTSADPTHDKIKIDNQEIKIIKKAYLLMNKPPGYVTSTHDPHEKTIMKLLPQKYKDLNVYPAGRLDKDTEGLLILTNDGDFANNIMHPTNNIKKTYEGVALGKLSKKDIDALKRGIKLEEGIAKCEIKITPDIEKTIFEIKLETGWTRQIRRMFDAVGHDVMLLRRTKIGNLTLDELKDEPIKEYTKEELERKIKN